jgi:hypothetical protein
MVDPFRLEAAPDEERGAILSDDGVYRYRLWRRWDPTRPTTAFVMLNPSTADALRDDPTLRRCVGFARSWGDGGLVIVNLHAFRTPNPRELAEAAGRGVDIVGPANDDHVRAAFAEAHRVVFAWGASTLAPGVARRVRDALPADREVCCLGVTAHGHPRHPLYVAADAPRIALSRSEVPCG